MRLMACAVDDINPCPSDQIVYVHSTATELFLNGGFESELFWIVIGGCFGTWIVGLGVGMIISIVRKSKNF